METRTLIYLTDRPVNEWVDELVERGWDVKVISTSKQISMLETVGVVAGGVVDVRATFAISDSALLERALSIASIGWIAIVGQGQLHDEPDLRRLIHGYCSDYVTQPPTAMLVAQAVGHAYGMLGLAEQRVMPTVAAVAEGEMVGACEAMHALFRAIRKVAMTDAPVFIAGESGTGKELTAAAIHRRSVRHARPFVAINCGAIPRELIQSELFGHERGAFTGANQRRLGRIESANGGTLFLDEIGDLPLESQASLLRFLQESTVDRLGGTESIDVNVRIISATHVNLEAAVRDGRFREDLFHRLCVLHLEVPPLRERSDDIELLADHMLARFRQGARRKLHGFAPDALQAIARYGWPGNVRELGNRVQRAVIMSEGRRITAADLELEHLISKKGMTLNRARELAERQAIEQALLRHRGRYVDAARELGVSRVTLYRLLGAHGLRDQTDPAPDRASAPVG
ncbi:sigma-54 dependent transcriptional regulator [Burkholderia sp. Ac-20365]|uniref:sigma-54 dependent transcriptional regulator n=1 Tax=Burkholderia sp. Ac-20365 TaxID=2703897 RepID=UPI00197C2772|nr:sigma-54 dependent transcriptional regulator [Burkholderia sp. Ac-20365]MBN3760508.1 sigma-54-dependent Fis family transcriptional regulator [Burkholderia sp. Ac-20365]